jgi:hypothetical protein
MNAKEKLKTMSQISRLIIMDIKSAGTALTLRRTRRRSATLRPRAKWAHLNDEKGAKNQRGSRAALKDAGGH